MYSSSTLVLGINFRAKFVSWLSFWGLAMAIRLLFFVGPDGLTLKSARLVNRRALPSQHDRNVDDHAGAWVELRGDDGALLYRRAVNAHLLEDEVELFSQDAARPIHRRPVANHARLLAVFAPDNLDAATLHIVQRTGQRPERRNVARERAVGGRPVFELDHARLDLKSMRLEPLVRAAQPPRGAISKTEGR